MIPTLLVATVTFVIAFTGAPPADIDGIREPVSGGLLHGNNIIVVEFFGDSGKWKRALADAIA
jgi:hypothetical protein